MALVDFSLGDVGSTLTSIREAITGKKIEDPVEQARVELQLTTLENALLTGQLKINEAEAQHPSIWVAGARPFIMWACGVAFIYASLVEPLLRFVCTVTGWYTGEFPVIDNTLTAQVLLGLLGLGVMRSVDKYQGTDTKRMR